MKGLSFSEPMVKAWMAERKPITRRLMNPQPQYQWADGKPAFMQAEHTPKPPYLPGETIYIKETWCREISPDGGEPILYRADYAGGKVMLSCGSEARWKSPRFMPEWASRSHALIISVRPEQIQSITDEEIAKEGLDVNFHDGNIATAHVHLRNKIRHSTARECFRALWESLYPGSWGRNDWVWRIELEMMQ